MRLTEEQYGAMMLGRCGQKASPSASNPQQSPSGEAAGVFTVTVGVPPSVNNAYVNLSGKRGKKGGRQLSEEAKAFKEKAQSVITSAAIVQRFRCPENARLSLSLTVYFKDNRRRDLSNIIKLAEDSLATALGFDDCRVDSLFVERATPDAGGARCEVELAVIG